MPVFQSHDFIVMLLICLTGANVRVKETTNKFNDIQLALSRIERAWTVLAARGGEFDLTEFPYLKYFPQPMQTFLREVSVNDITYLKTLLEQSRRDHKKKNDPLHYLRKHRHYDRVKKMSEDWADVYASLSEEAKAFFHQAMLKSAMMIALFDHIDTIGYQSALDALTVIYDTVFNVFHQLNESVHDEIANAFPEPVAFLDDHSWHEMFAKDATKLFKVKVINDTEKGINKTIITRYSEDDDITQRKAAEVQAVHVNILFDNWNRYPSIFSFILNLFLILLNCYLVCLIAKQLVDMY